MLYHSQNQKLQYLIFFAINSYRQEGGNAPQSTEPLPGLEGGLDPQEFIQTNWDECVESFDAMDLREELLRGIYA